MSPEREPTPTPEHDLAIGYAKMRIKRLVRRADAHAAAGLVNAEEKGRKIVRICQQDLATLEASQVAASRR